MNTSRHNSHDGRSERRQRRQSRGDDEDVNSLLLTRTRSADPGIVEGVAVQNDYHDDSSSEAGSHDIDDDDDDDETSMTKAEWPHSVRYMVMLCGFFTSLSFGVTQVPLVYVFRLMTCDAYYKSHPLPGGSSIPRSPQGGSTISVMSIISYALSLPVTYAGHDVSSRLEADHCSIHTIESSTALSLALLGASNTVFGILNLFLAGSLIKSIGVKRTLIIQIFFPALRLLVQNIGVEVWGTKGIIIIQCSQLVSLLGGPSGYMLVLNTFVTEVVEYEGRTAALGRLAGSMMFGSALGFLIGGITADAYGIKIPFRLTFALFLASCAYVVFFLPYITPSGRRTAEAGSADRKKSVKRTTNLLGPLATFAPRKFITRDGTVVKNYGALLLAFGVFLGILATGYLQTLLQLYSTDVFGFGTRENGWLIFMYSALRGLFLTFAFPKLISLGRKLTAARKERLESTESERQPLLTVTEPGSTNAVPEPHSNHQGKKQQAFTFDLTYAQISLIADGTFTLLCTFVREGWQLYVVAAILPFAAGTGSAAKGTVLQMIGSSASSSERTDALAGLSLVENMARLSTTFGFALIFAAFTSIGHVELVFTCNALVALIGFVVLLFARFPPEDSRRLDADDVPVQSE